MFIASPAAHAAVASTSHSLPRGGSAGVTTLCGPAANYSCTTGGYDGTASQWGTNNWTSQHYWAYGSPLGAAQRHNCTTYAAFKLQANGYAYPGWTENANNWARAAASARTLVNQTPAVGAIAQWNTDPGHVAYVEVVTSSYIEITDDSYSINTTSRSRIPLNSASRPDNYIHFKDVVSGPLKDGDFVRVSDNGEIYRIAGGAPIYVGSWARIGGEQPTVPITRSKLNALRSVPADGTFIRAYSGSSTVYTIAGGAPIAVGNWDRVGGPHSVVEVDKGAIDQAGGSGVWSHLRDVPAPGTFIRAYSGNDTIYRIAGGAPIAVASWARVGGEKPFATVDKAAIDNAGQAGAYSHLRHRPLEGTLLRSGVNGAFYVVRSGAPIQLSSTPSGSSVVIDPVAISNAGQPGVWSHLAAPPAAPDAGSPGGGSGSGPGTTTPGGSTGTTTPGGSTGTTTPGGSTGTTTPGGPSVSGSFRRLIRGSARSEILRGTSGADRILAFGGNDRIFGLAGNDLIDGLSGDDRIDGGPGHDNMDGGAGNDQIDGRGGNDKLVGRDGNDRLIGRDGNDTLIGGRGHNSYYGGPGRDTIYARNGVAETVNCGPGRDTVHADRSDRLIGCEVRR